MIVVRRLNCCRNEGRKITRISSNSPFLIVFSNVVVDFTEMSIEGPDSPGVWRHAVNSCWELYPSEIADLIFTSFSWCIRQVEWVDRAKRTSYDRDEPTHRVDLKRMKEVEISTGIEVPISIVQAPISFTNYKPTQNTPTEAGVWWWRDNSERWHSYSSQANHNILKSKARKQQYVTFTTDVPHIYPHVSAKVIDLTSMEESSTKSSKKVPILIVSGLTTTFNVNFLDCFFPFKLNMRNWY